jgi:hypothetical protein
MAIVGEVGWIGKNCPTHPVIRLVSTAMHSNAGWFVGTYCERCREADPSPHSRETDYYPTKQELIDVLFAGTVRWRDTQFRGMKLLNNTDALVFDFKTGEEQPTDHFAVICPIHQRQFLTQRQYDAQMNDPNSKWKCPKCNRVSRFDDATYEAYQEALEKQAAEASHQGDGDGNT